MCGLTELLILSFFWRCQTGKNDSIIFLTLPRMSELVSMASKQPLTNRLS